MNANSIKDLTSLFNVKIEAKLNVFGVKEKFEYLDIKIIDMNQINSLESYY